MVEGDAGDDGNIGLIGVDRIEPAAEADFEESHVDPGVGKDFPGGQRAELEIGQRHIAGLCRAASTRAKARTAPRRSPAGR
jgi:hypothetical protein